MILEYSIYPSPRRTSDQLQALVPGYATGYWTPGFAYGGGTIGQSYLFQRGTYIKIGRIIHLFFRVAQSVRGSSTGDVTLTGFPFRTRIDIAGGLGEAVHWQSMLLNVEYIHIDIPENSIIGNFKGTNDVTGESFSLTEAYFSNSTDIRGHVVYESRE